MSHKEIVRSGYNKIADLYLEARDRDSENVGLLTDLFELLAPGAKVLDAGCGAGIPITQKLAERYNVVGVDFSEAQIKLAKKNVSNAQFTCVDMTRLNFERESFDGICSYYAIIHIPRKEHERLLTSFYRMLKPGGVALLCLGAEDLEDDIDENYFGTSMYWSHYNDLTYVEMLKDIGYRIIWARRIADSTCDSGEHLFTLLEKGLT